eukprot:CAMPEP_0172363036 /NCGR_PEP_ID=MMETSP1060-20121228/6503_1 /TAXON_ID=37318 /ORGANISM="Pseudo-nitzschia pungens, Strain cf. cingulata" /LENGTH=732 /DNA_ID=CAMNT_0013085685 /DNA_START=403 /DNA_END=2601 /DNA_ORIENTATION=+
MRRASTPSSSASDRGGSASLSPSSPGRSVSAMNSHPVHGPWNRKSVTTILAQQQQLQQQHYPQHPQQQCQPPQQQQQQQQQPYQNAHVGADRDSHGDHNLQHTNVPPPEPSYTLWDLVSVGVGGTVGSGIFVLTGYINHHYAGPATFLSFAISGLAALCSGISFAEFSGRLPRIEGSTYTYAYVSMGEYAAVLAAACLTLEYGVSGAAVARSWGDKMLEWTAQWSTETQDNDNDNDDVVSSSSEALFNPLAGIISMASVVVLACGVQESKAVTNFFTVTKMILVGIMIVGGFCLFSPSNMSPLVVPFDGSSYGVAGILRGATSSFFGYLGFDEVCCLASEAKNPNDTPRAILYTLAIVTAIYILASIALSGMLPYQEVSDTSGFPRAFGTLGWNWVSNLTALGEVATLPVVVLISLLAQPRLCAAMARDGLLPEIFCRQSPKDGNLFWSNILCGIPMTLLATFVPFSWMDDAISVGILFAFNMTNTALVVMRCGGTVSASAAATDGILKPATLEGDGEIVTAVDEANGIVSSFRPQRRSGWPLRVHLGCYHGLALLAGLTSHLGTSSTSSTSSSSSPNWSVQIGAAAVTLAYAAGVHRWFPCTGAFGDDASSGLQRHDSNADFSDDPPAFVVPDNIFKVPLCPFLPLVGIYLNWYLISQLEWSGMVLLLVFLVVISALYCGCVRGKPSVSLVYSPLQQHSPLHGPLAPPAHLGADGPVLLRELSLPSRRAVT